MTSADVALMGPVELIYASCAGCSKGVGIGQPLAALGVHLGLETCMCRRQRPQGGERPSAGVSAPDLAVTLPKQAG